MRTPEEVAREFSVAVIPDLDDAEESALADFIRAHVAEMAELIESLTIENAGLKGDVKDVLNSLDISVDMSLKVTERVNLRTLQFQVGALLGRWREDDA